jgi:heat shock protein HslJ
MHRLRSRGTLVLGGLVLAVTACGAPAADKRLPAVTPIMMPPAIAAASGDELPGRTWVWQGTTFSGDREVVPDAPERYTLEFMPDGRVRLRADCNRGSAHYEAGANRALALTPAAITKKGCPPGSKDSEFLRALGDVAGYRFIEGDLVLALKLDGGAMRFAPAAR